MENLRVRLLPSALPSLGAIYTPLNSRDQEERAEHSTGDDLTASEFRAMVPNQGDYGAEGRSAMSANILGCPKQMGSVPPAHTGGITICAEAVLSTGGLSSVPASTRRRSEASSLVPLTTKVSPETTPQSTLLRT